MDKLNDCRTWAAFLAFSPHFAFGEIWNSAARSCEYTV